MFVRSEKDISDDWILEVLGLGHYRSADALFDSQRHVVIGNSPNWTVVGDDFEWAKFHWPSAPEVLSRLVSAVDEVFLCLFPDVDDGFEIFYWRNGALVRSYQKTSKDWGQSYDVQETGTPLPAETGPLDVSPTERVKTIAHSLGFDLNDSLSTYRVFAGPQMEQPGFRFEDVLTNIPRELWDNPILGPRLRWRRE